MEWELLWKYFELASNEIKVEIWKQLRLNEHLKSLTSKYQIEVLKHAPDEVIGLVINTLHLETRIKLGLQEKEKPAPAEKKPPRVIRMVIT